MTTLEPVPAISTEATAFKGIKKAGAMKKHATAVMENLAGVTCAATTKNPAVLKEIVTRETMLGHFDFVKGINEYLSRQTAKNVYKK